ncbi:MAG TPA: antibiotic biosynthesis monooxygenase [Syntrophaceae bacterium]|jgi:quinol monooxygenase YgiN|nr:antibiotic biosynthesis monooxygenase [Syntrophaceae bacterium]
MIYVIATVEIIEGKRGEYLRELKKVIPDVRAETGCLEYGPAGDIATDIPVQAPVNEHVVTIIERWTDIQALKDHLQSPHMKTYREATKSVIRGLGVRILKPL